MANQSFCEKCKRTLDVKNFYTSKNLEKYPSGVLPQCKKCITLHLDNFNPETYKWILKEIDVPYIQDEWNKLLEKHQDSAKRLSGTSILGKYLAKMKLHQFAQYTWADSEALEEKIREEKIAAMRKIGYTNDEIENVLAEKDIEVEEMKQKAEATLNGFDSSVVSLDAEESEEAKSLTKEDRAYLRNKWGSGYSADDWIHMEQLYEDMMSSYDIQTAGHKDTLVLICKASLKANQLIDLNDVEGFQKMSRVYDVLMKSGNFTANQNKIENGDSIDSVGELVAMCEKEGFIPRYYQDEPKDKVDRTLQDLQNYTRTLVTEELNLGNLIENATKQIAQDKAREAQMNTDDDDVSDAALFEETIKDDKEIVDDKFDLFDFEDNQVASDKEFYKSLERGEID